MLALATMSAAKAYPADPLVTVDKFLDCIAMKEQQDQKTRIISHGERSIYGITEAVWTDRMPGLPFKYCTDLPWYAKFCATKHLNWLANELDKAGVPPDCYALAGAWHEGLSGFLKLHKWRQVVQYGRDVENLYGATKP